MRFFISRRSAARLVFGIGLFFMFLGTAFLIGSLETVSRGSVFFSFFFVLAGIGCAFLAIKLNKRSLYLFFAALFLQIGLFLFLQAVRVIPFGFSKAWPVLSIFTGIALVAAGWHRYGVFNRRYLAPSVVFIALGAALLVFSLDLVSFSLFQFVAAWWPLLLALAGLMLILIALGTKNFGEDK